MAVHGTRASAKPRADDESLSNSTPSDWSAQQSMGTVGHWAAQSSFSKLPGSFVPGTIPGCGLIAHCWKLAVATQLCLLQQHEQPQQKQQQQQQQQQQRTPIDTSSAPAVHGDIIILE
ncbi:hypothetical protein COCMIDRAFT_4553 [Bipolaris oryzae ATCC 44560]|uniref:Uncharacterized protein n=1 Tax=Bipolaris oryzae ATCC 44560 TaxID=930090 RepID=W6ZFU5_COCMI|nr:uncharacterized protein COCMIDRAFT_4553 [Bipolaris oryzae ATCC 44560]EUC46389.1 hypothetical protein COCMIDRAFT_4553 [Bipolaris oryzae ATCC 44560]